ncbi:GerW family sporulation protein [Sulfoacidibacillus thermotolerans]|uniref:Sporulation protein YtfJ n=1 Tax=Sulfoacidibacillus thermotolerans TaxID=1765684 RepID=A0A2U3D5R1_SULT2|nr:GerW family sporulation protein [Sulfoacidibacillus thermotolerans]PWI56613.1 sporulation protein YtfJ [Sulfoacidibacillus thermotolerans]
MQEHPIQSLMQTAMENLKEMVDVNTIIGDPVETPDGNIILPISRVGFGFAAGGTEFRLGKEKPTSSAHTAESQNLPFGGGAGGGVSISPMGFLIVGQHGVKLLSAEPGNQLYDRLIDLTPTLIDRLEAFAKGKKSAANGTRNSNGSNASPPPPM